MIATLLAALVPLAAPQDRISVEVRSENGDVYCDIRADDAQVHNVIRSLCRKAELPLTGFEDIEESPRVSAFLRNRPLSVAANYVLGAAGLSGHLSADGLEVSPAEPAFPARNELLELAEISLLEALQQYPEGSHAANFRKELARIAVLRGELAKAARHYELLISTTPEESDHIDTRMRAARILVELREWGRALPYLRFVAENGTIKSVAAEARRELARCVLMRGESARALHMLRALENIAPPTDDRDATERLLLMARAEVGMGRPLDALRSLDRARQVGSEYIDELEAMDLRARALELEGKPVEAAMAWLHFSRSQDEDSKREALIRAAEIALANEGEELALIFLHKHAQNEGFGDSLLPHVNEARARLGLEGASYSQNSLATRLSRAVQLADAGMEDSALQALETMEPLYGGLAAADRVTFALTYAALLERSHKVTGAIDLLRDVVRTLESVDNRSLLYMLAGEIYERAGRFEDAAAAYGGRL
jgi:tetratricopeptide (TPR) repeat protein